MNIKRLLISPVLLAGALGLCHPLQAGFKEESIRVEKEKYPYIGRIIRLLGDAPERVHLLGCNFTNADAAGTPAIVRIDGQEVPAERINGFRISLNLPENVPATAYLTVTVAGKESLREKLGSPVAYASPRNLLLPDGRDAALFCIREEVHSQWPPKYEDAHTKPYDSKISYNAVVREAFSGQLQEAAPAAAAESASASPASAPAK